MFMAVKNGLLNPVNKLSIVASSMTKNLKQDLLSNANHI